MEENSQSKIESLLFISGRAMSAKQIAELMGIKPKEVEDACEKFLSEQKEKKSGIQIIKNGNDYQMVTSPENSKLIQEFIKDETTGELTRPSLETLTIIAYRGPISKTNIERIRGINCSLILRNLSMRGLVESKHDSRKDETYYNISFDFLRHLGLNDIKELPGYEELHKEETIDKIIEENNEEKEC